MMRIPQVFLIAAVNSVLAAGSISDSDDGVEMILDSSVGPVWV